jgi:DNA-binding response OmpR family regulator
MNPIQTKSVAGRGDIMNCKYLQIDDIKIDFVRREISVDGILINMTPREFNVVEFLLDNLNKVVSRTEIQEAVWGRELDVSSRTLDTHISRIRSKLRLDDGKNIRVIPVYSKGYRVVLFDAALMHVEAFDTPARRDYAPARNEYVAEYAA